MTNLTERITTLEGKILNDGISPDEARAQHARLCSEGVAHRWEHWGGEQTMWNAVARFDAVDDVHAPKAVAS